MTQSVYPICPSTENSHQRGAFGKFYLNITRYALPSHLPPRDRGSRHGQLEMIGAFRFPDRITAAETQRQAG